MQNQILLASMIVIGVLTGLIVGAVMTLIWHNWRSKQFRARHDIPDILGNWRCQWFDDSIDSDKPKVEDTVEIRKWSSNGEFLARGYQPQFNLSYPIIGDIDPSRVVTLIYKAARYPYEPNRGVICMELSRDGNTMEGRWFGRRFSGELSGGRVRCLRAPNTAAV
ncbi:MAG TPA: hypothetical protein VJS64_15755 [Pyrinomonadaceae bacterium]|nr:hypothetical protein [Pyrinomonadaceae bacterium]